jgi:hypothetical protein
MNQYRRRKRRESGTYFCYINLINPKMIHVKTNTPGFSLE